MPAGPPPTMQQRVCDDPVHAHRRPLRGRPSARGARAARRRRRHAPRDRPADAARPCSPGTCRGSCRPSGRAPAGPAAARSRRRSSGRCRAGRASTQSLQKVHSKLQMRASVDVGRQRPVAVFAGGTKLEHGLSVAGAQRHFPSPSGSCASSRTRPRGTRCRARRCARRAVPARRRPPGCRPSGPISSRKKPSSADGGDVADLLFHVLLEVALDRRHRLLARFLRDLDRHGGHPRGGFVSDSGATQPGRIGLLRNREPASAKRQGSSHRLADADARARGDAVQVVLGARRRCETAAGRAAGR